MISRIYDFTDIFEMDPATHWIKAFRADGDFYLVEPSAAIQLGTWATQHTAELIKDQQALNQQKDALSEDQSE